VEGLEGPTGPANTRGRTGLRNRTDKPWAGKRVMDCPPSRLARADSSVRGPHYFREPSTWNGPGTNSTSAKLAPRRPIQQAGRAY